MKKITYCLLFNLIIITGIFAHYDLTIIGPINMADGIGRQAIEHTNALKSDFSINVVSRDINRKDVPYEVLKIIDNSSKEVGDVVIFEDIISKTPYIAGFFRKFKNKIKIAYSMTESTAILDYWVDNLNRGFDAVVVPDSFLIDVYKNSGVTIPIFVIPLGLDLSAFLNEPLKQTKNNPFIFANFATYENRKNHKALIESFYEAFGNDPSVELWINGRTSYNNYYSKDIFEEVKQQIKSLGVSNIVATKGRLDNQQYLDKFKKIDCYVNLSKGEGFSIQPREAMALGIPVILSNNTAQTTICRSNLVKSINCLVSVPAYYDIFHDFLGLQYEFDKEEAVEALRQMKSNYEDELKNSFLRRSWVNQYNYSELCPLYKTLVRPKEVFLGDENLITKDYLVTTSKSLYRKYKKLLGTEK